MTAFPYSNYEQNDRHDDDSSDKSVNVDHSALIGR